MYGILKDSTNTGSGDELACQFAAPVAIGSNRIIFASDSLSLKRFTATGPAQRWEIEVAIAPSNDGVDFFLNNLVSDVNEEIYVRMPQPIQKVGTATGAMRGSSSGGTELLSTDGTTILGYTSSIDVGLGTFANTSEQYPSSSPSLMNNSDYAIASGEGKASLAFKDTNIVGITLNVGSRLFKGSFIKFAGHKKVYLIYAINSIYSNTLNVSVYPPLTNDVSNGETAYLGESVAIPMKYDTDSVVGMRYSDGIVSDPGVVRLVENL
jgi:hypothetical protein